MEREAVGIRRDGLYTPRDFDVSPFFAVVKPTIEAGFDFHRWPADRRRSFIQDWASASLEQARRKIEAGVRAMQTGSKRLAEPEDRGDGAEAAPPEAGR